MGLELVSLAFAIPAFVLSYVRPRCQKAILALSSIGLIICAATIVYAVAHLRLCHEKGGFAIFS